MVRRCRSRRSRSAARQRTPHQRHATPRHATWVTPRVCLRCEFPQTTPVPVADLNVVRRRLTLSGFDELLEAQREHCPLGTAMVHETPRVLSTPGAMQHEDNGFGTASRGRHRDPADHLRARLLGPRLAQGTPQLRARQELMRQQGPAFVEELMDELRTRHLDQRRPHDDRPLPSERLQAAYSAASLDGGTVG